MLYYIVFFNTYAVYYHDYMRILWAQIIVIIVVVVFIGVIVVFIDVVFIVVVHGGLLEMKQVFPSARPLRGSGHV